MTSPFFRRFVSAAVLLLALTIGPLLSSATSQVSVSVHMPFGNVSGAGSSSNNLLVTREQFAASWNASKRTPNWVAWRLLASDLGSAPRSNVHVDPDPVIRILSPSDYAYSGYDRGHVCPSADRTDSTKNNLAVSTMLNTIPQAPDNNQGPWRGLEDYTRSLARDGREVYVIAGGVGSLASFKEITVPESMWKVIVALPPGKTFPDVSESTIIAVLMPNINGIKRDDWRQYQTTMPAIASLTGYKFSNYPHFDETEAKIWRRRNELKQKVAKIKQVAQSTTATRKRKELAAKGAAELENVITATETMLKDSTLTSNPEKRAEIFAHAESELVRSTAIASFTERKVDIPHSSSVSDNLAVAKVKKWTDGDGGFKGSSLGNAFLGLGANTSTSVTVNAAYAPTTPKAAADNASTYGSSGGGILLEGAAGGMGRISTVKYDGRYNALVMDDHLVYFMKAPSWEAAALCRDIARDKLMRVGVSMGKTSLVYGDKSTYENTGVARNLLLADQFLGDFVFGKHKWTKGYKFPNGYKPQITNVTADLLVQFVFKGFQFVTKDNELQITNLAVNVRFMPVSKKPAPDGGMLPDMDALTRGYAPPPAFLANAQYLTSHFEYFRQERIVAKTIAYGELAALFRHYKQAGVNLESLASAMERG